MALNLLKKKFTLKGKGGKGKGKNGCKLGKKGPITKSLKAGLNFPVGRLHRMLK